MAYAVVEDFRGGLDRRRKRVAGYPGTLWECINAHITRGGEVEKRKKFVAKHTLPTSQTFGMESAGGALYVFGSAATPAGMPAGVTYQQLLHPDGVAMAAILDTEVFDGDVYAIAEYADGSVHHFYDGALVQDWDAGVVRVGMVNNDGMAEHLRALIDADAAYVATRAGNVITITAAVAGTAFTITAGTENVAGGTDDQTITLVQTVPNITGVAESLAHGDFTIVGGTSNPGIYTIATVMVNGIDILGGAVDWSTSHSVTATNVAAQIVSNVSSPEYTATANGATVTISAAAGSGATPNNFTVAVTVGVVDKVDVVVSPTMAGGVTAAAGQAQVYTATIGGTWDIGDRFTITIDDKIFGASGNPSAKARYVFTHKSKVHALVGSLDQFCAVNDPTKWNDVNTGAGFQNMASQDSGSEALVSIGKFQGNLAYFARRTVQTWRVDVDEALSVILQALENTGTMAARSVLSYGDVDLFYLSDSGVRSIRQSQGTDSVYANDVGTAIDDLVIAQMRSLTAADLAAAVAIIEPVDNRYWLVVGDVIFVFSFFAASKISAWSTYEVGVTFTEMTVIGTKVYARAGDTIYLYGGDDGVTYDADASDAYTVTVTLPFLTMGKVATDKEVTGFDVGADGTWAINLLHDSNDDARKTRLGIVTDDTYKADDLAASGYGPLFAPQLICTTAGAAKIANFVLHEKEG